jgi:hypothetical protein
MLSSVFSYFELYVKTSFLYFSHSDTRGILEGISVNINVYFSMFHREYTWGGTPKKLDQLRGALPNRS